MLSPAKMVFLAILLMMGTVSANSLMFYGSADNCDIGSDHIGCFMHPPGVCCNSHAPFCVNLLLGVGSAPPGTEYTQYVVHQDYCHLSKNGGSYCTQGGPDNTADCCIDKPPGGGDGSTCSAFWLEGDTGATPHGWKKRDMDMDMDMDGDGGCMDPNYLSYNDGSETKKIFLPNGTLQLALEAYNRKDFSALAVYKSLAEVMGNDTEVA